jgi:hypothetical protein
MGQHHTKDSGDLGVLKAQLDLHEKGFVVSVPLSEHAPFDLVAYRNGECKTVQVKYRSLRDERGTLTVHFRSSYSDSNGHHTQKVDKEEIDVYGIYCPETDECYYLSPDEFGKTVSLRVEPPENNQTTNVNFASDYLEVP